MEWKGGWCGIPRAWRGGGGSPPLLHDLRQAHLHFSLYRQSGQPSSGLGDEINRWSSPLKEMEPQAVSELSNDKQTDRPSKVMLKIIQNYLTLVGWRTDSQSLVVPNLLSDGYRRSKQSPSRDPSESPTETTWRTISFMLQSPPWWVPTSLSELP